jgi:hypothetical protein
MKKKLTIAELEDLLNKDEDINLVILPNGEITVNGDKTINKKHKPITM